MVAKTGRAGPRWAFVLMLGALAAPLRAAPPVHVMAHGDPLEQDVAYVVLVPHLQVMGRSQNEVDGVITGATFDGQPREYGLSLTADRPTLVRVAPGRYHFASLDIGRYHWSLSEDQSMFEARPGQLNYPGDWNVSVDEHDIMVGARKIGWRIDAALYTSQGAVDASQLDVDAAFAALKPAYTRLDPPSAHPGGFGER